MLSFAESHKGHMFRFATQDLHAHRCRHGRISIQASLTQQSFQIGVGCAFSIVVSSMFIAWLQELLEPNSLDEARAYTFVPCIGGTREISNWFISYVPSARYIHSSLSCNAVCRTCWVFCSSMCKWAISSFFSISTSLAIDSVRFDIVSFCKDVLLQCKCTFSFC